MRTLVIAERPFHDLRSRAILEELGARLGEPVLGLVTAAERAPAGFAPVPPDPGPAWPEFGRVILAGVFRERPRLEKALRLAGAAMARGARLETRNLGVEGPAARPEPPAGLHLLDQAAPFELRDHRSALTIFAWGVSTPPVLAAYPERRGPADPALAEGLPAGPILGLALLGGPEPQKALATRGQALRALLDPFRGWPVLALPVEAADSPVAEDAVMADFLAGLLPGAARLLPALGDPAFRRRQLTPARLRGLVARCAHVVTSHDLLAALAIGAGVPVLALALAQDRRVAACLATLANQAPPGSNLVYPPPDPAPGPATSSAR